MVRFSGRVIISIRIHISTRNVHVRHPHTHIPILPVTEVVTSITSPSSFVNALANDHTVNFTRRQKFHFTESTSGLLKMHSQKYFCKFVNRITQEKGHTKIFILILSQLWSWVISARYMAVTIMPFKVIQGHRLWQSISIESLYATYYYYCDVPPILYRFQDIADYWSNFHYR